jgi:hypothetical protein
MGRLRAVIAQIAGRILAQRHAVANPQRHVVVVHHDIPGATRVVRWYCLPSRVHPQSSRSNATESDIRVGRLSSAALSCVLPGRLTHQRDACYRNFGAEKVSKRRCGIVERSDACVSVRAAPRQANHGAVGGPGGDRGGQPTVGTSHPHPRRPRTARRRGNDPRRRQRAENPGSAVAAGD